MCIVSLGPTSVFLMDVFPIGNCMFHHVLTNPNYFCYYYLIILLVLWIYQGLPRLICFSIFYNYEYAIQIQCKFNNFVYC